MRFSERQGLSPIRDMLQKDDMDSGLRACLWNGLDICIFTKTSATILKSSNLYNFFMQVWHRFLKMPLDNLSAYTHLAQKDLRERFFRFKWFEVYDFIEFTAENCPGDCKEKFLIFCNEVLQNENSAYRFVGTQIAPIISESEIESIENATNISDTFGGVKMHLHQALTHLSSKTNPDFRNSIKESISSVEALAQTLSGNTKATLGDALKILEKDKKLHSALKASFSSLYGYTSDEGGIRHAMLEESELDFHDAKLMLVTCTAFINYMIGKLA